MNTDEPHRQTDLITAKNFLNDFQRLQGKGFRLIELGARNCTNAKLYLAVIHLRENLRAEERVEAESCQDNTCKCRRHDDPSRFHRCPDDSAVGLLDDPKKQSFANSMIFAKQPNGKHGQQRVGKNP